MSDATDPAAAIAAAVATVSAVVAPMQEAAIGYRTRLIEMGMGKDAADRCAADYHQWLLTMLPTGGGSRYGAGGKR